MPKQDSLNPKDKAAILMISLGKDYAAKLYKYLSEDEIEQLTFSITSVRRVDTEVRESVTKEFFEICMAQKFISEGGIDYAREVLDKAFGETKANELIANISSALRVRPFDFIRRADSAQVCNFLQNEHPQTIAMVLSYLDPAQAAMVLASLPLDKQTNVIARIANMGASTPEYVKEAETVLERKLSSLIFGNQQVMGGIDALVQVLNCVDRGTERHMLESLEETDADLADQIRNRMFVFEDITKLSSQAIQRVLKEIDNHDLTVALKGATAEVSRVIFDNISKRLQEMIKEDIEIMGPVRVRDVEEAQQKIVNVIRKLDDAGEIIITRGGQEDSVIV
jgi:flagellar motor switch protein FliG